MVGLVTDHAQLSKHYNDEQEYKELLSEAIFNHTYPCSHIDYGN